MDASSVAKEKIRFWLRQIEGLKTKHKAGEISDEVYKARVMKYRHMIEGVQSVFRSVYEL